MSDTPWDWLTIDSSYERVGAKAVVGLKLNSSDPSRRVAHIKAVLDVKPLVNEALEPPQCGYERSFEPTGLALPGVMHTLKIVVTDEAGQVLEIKRQYQS